MADEPRPKNPPALAPRPPAPARESKESQALAAIQEALAGIRFGVVQIVIQDGRIVQIEKTEKVRLV